MCGLLDESRRNSETCVVVIELCCGATTSLPCWDIVNSAAALGKVVEMAEKVRDAYELHRQDPLKKHVCVSHQLLTLSQLSVQSRFVVALR